MVATAFQHHAVTPPALTPSTPGAHPLGLIHHRCSGRFRSTDQVLGSRRHSHCATASPISSGFQRLTQDPDQGMRVAGATAPIPAERPRREGGRHATERASHAAPSHLPTRRRRPRPRAATRPVPASTDLLATGQPTRGPPRLAAASGGLQLRQPVPQVREASVAGLGASEAAEAAPGVGALLAGAADAGEAAPACGQLAPHQ